MIISQVNYKKEGISYPVLKEYKDRSFVMLFTAPSTGVCVWSKDHQEWRIGEYSSELIDNEFTAFTGTITLSND